MGGLAAGVVTTAASLIAGNVTLMQPVGILEIADTRQAFGMGFFVVVGIATSVFADRFRKRSEALQESETRLKMVHHTARVGTFEVNVQIGVTTWSRALKTFRPEECEWRIVCPDGKIRWIFARLLAFKDRLGKPERLVGLDIDIKEQPATTVFIKDNGIGIEKRLHERIFKMFQRNTDNEHSGTGIGLAIVRKAVEHMNGRVSLESEPGKGTCFHVELPRPR